MDRERFVRSLLCRLPRTTIPGQGYQRTTNWISTAVKPCRFCGGRQCQNRVFGTTIKVHIAFNMRSVE